MQVLEAENVANTMTAKKMIAAVAVEEEKNHKIEIRVRKLKNKMKVQIIKSNLMSTIKPRILVKKKKKVFMKQKMAGFIV